MAGAVEEPIGNDDVAASADTDAGRENESSTTSDPGSTPEVTIEPPPNTAAPIPQPDKGCSGAGFAGETSSITTRIGVLVPDYSDLIETGFVPRVTPAEYRNRYLATIEGANARGVLPGGDSNTALPCGELELIFATYDPIDPESQRDACLELTSGAGVLAVVAELDDRRGEALECLLTEAGVPVVVAGPVSEAELEANQGRLISLRAPAELLGRNAVARYAELTDLESANIAIVGGDGVVTSAATDAIVAELDSRGLSAVVVARLPDSVGTTEVWAQLPALAEDLADAEVSVVISVFDAVVINALWDRMLDIEAEWVWMLADVSGIGEHDEVTRLPDEFAGLVVTSLTSQKEAPREDAASQRCIVDYASLIERLQPETPTDTTPATTVVATSTPPTTLDSAEGTDQVGESDEVSDDGLEVSSRELLGEQRPPGPSCALLSVVTAAISEAGPALNTDTFVDALAMTGPIELFIEGSGSLTSDKHYVADFTQVLSFTRYVAPLSVELVAPCGSPDNCWRSIDAPEGGLQPVS